MPPKLHREELLRELKQAFPELTADLNAEMGILSLEVEAFRHFVQRMINEGERETVREAFSIARRFYLGGDGAMREIIDTCLVEDLDFSDTKKRSRGWAWELLPEELKLVYRQFHGS